MPMEWGWFGTSYPEVLDKVPFNFLYKTFEVKLDENGWVGAFPFAVFAVATGLFIYCVLSISDKQSDVKEISDKHKEAKSNERLIKRLNTNIPNLEHNINEAKKELIEEQNKLNNIKVTVKQMTKEANNNANKIAADGNVIYKALVKTFSSLLDERDWQNLDYIIFSFETGRALTIKDALFYVDRERETERIVASIQEANRNLSKVIRAEVGSLKSAMERSFYELNENLRACTKSINENITNTGGSIVNSINQANMITQANIQSLRGEMQNIAYNSEKLNAALINNINKPSNILIDDVHAIRRRINC
jgi:hypothetical protein